MYSLRTRNLFKPDSKEPFKLSRSRIENFLRCPRCFYLDRRLGVDQPQGFPFNLNSAVDHLLKKEFDVHRARQTAHPLMTAYKLPLVPFRHEKMDEWRENFVGVQYLHEATNLLITGAVDDLWLNPATKEIHVVDYKATSKDGDVGIDAEWQQGYRNQMEMYQWLLRRNGFDVSNTGYFVYANGRRDPAAFDGKLEFDVKVFPYEGSDIWIDAVLQKIKECLSKEELPNAAETCDHCAYRAAAHAVEKNAVSGQTTLF